MLRGRIERDDLRAVEATGLSFDRVHRTARGQAILAQLGGHRRDDIADAGRLAKLLLQACLLYTSDAAAERSSVALGGRRIIKKKNDQQPDRRTLDQIQNY